MTEAPSTKSRRNQRAGLVSIRIGATKIGGKPSAYWVPLAVAEKIERLCEKEGKDGNDSRN